MSAFDLYDGLILPLRRMDEEAGALFLKRYLTRLQYWRDKTEARIIQLPELYSPSKCPDELLDYLLAILGFTSRYRSILDRLSPATKRKLILMAAAFWKRLYTEEGAVVALRLLTGKTPYIRDWFDFRVIVGEVIVGEEQIGFDFWIIGDAITRFDEYTSQFRLMDDGTLDEILLLRVLEIMRPIQERFEVSLVDFLDLFEEGRGKWTTVSGSSGTITTDKTFLIPAGSVEAPSIPIAPDTDFHDYISIHKFKLPVAGGGAGHQFQFLRENYPNDYFYINVYPGVMNNVELWRVIGGFNILQATGSYAVATNTWYKLRVRSKFDAGLVGTFVRVFLDSSNVISMFVAGPTPSYGKVAYVALVNDMEVDNVEVFRDLPLRWAMIEPSGTTYSPNWVL